MIESSNFNIHLNIPAIDAQHQALFNLMGAMVIDHENGVDVGVRLHQLRAAIRSHFSYEEQEMRDAKYDAIEQHELAHRSIEIQIDAMIKNKTVTTYEQRFTSMLRDIIVTHVEIFDLPFGRFFHTAAQG